MKIFVYVLLSLAVAFGDDPVEKFIEGNHQFAQDVYNVLLQDNKDNILVSPFSAEVVLGLAQTGAAGSTGEEIRSVFHFGANKEETDEEFKSVLPILHSDYVTVYSANEVYVSEKYSVKEEYIQTAKDVYQSESQEVNFAQTVEAAEEINQRVKELTNNLIDELVDPKDFNDHTLVELVNVLYFEGNWSKQFNPQQSKKVSFYKSSEDTVDADMLYTEGDLYNYYDSKELDAQILEIPFLGGEASMTFVLPNQKEGIAVLEKQIPNVFTKPKYTQEVVEVTIPKFKIQTSINAVDVLKKLGIKKAFTLQEADFSGIAGAKGQLYISGAKQKAYIQVNEIGATAVAVTGLEISTGAVLKPTKFFLADHPFVFYISFKDIILYQGRVLTPEY